MKLGATLGNVQGYESEKARGDRLVISGKIGSAKRIWKREGQKRGKGGDKGKKEGR